MAVNVMSSVSFGGRDLPVWQYGDLYYVTFDTEIINGIMNLSFDTTERPNEKWVSGGSPELAIMAAIYATTMNMIQELKSNVVAKETLAELNESILAAISNAADHR